jgi:hypothetical protein
MMRHACAVVSQRYEYVCERACGKRDSLHHRMCVKQFMCVMRVFYMFLCVFDYTHCSMCGCVRMGVDVCTVKIVLFFPLLPRTPIGRVDIVRVTVLEGCACLPCVTYISNKWICIPHFQAICQVYSTDRVYDMASCKKLCLGHDSSIFLPCYFSAAAPFYSTHKKAHPFVLALFEV